MNKISFIDKVFGFNFLRKVFLMSSNNLKIVFYGIFFFTISVCDNINQQIEKNKFSVKKKIICLRLITKLCSPIVLSTHFRYIHWNDGKKFSFFDENKRAACLSLAVQQVNVDQCWLNFLSSAFEPFFTHIRSPRDSANACEYVR